MMQGYYWDSLCSTSGTGLFGYGWMVYAMGLGLVLVLGVALWLVWSQRTAHTNGALSLPMPFAPTPPRSDMAEEIARERFARGEIDRDEYDRVIAALRSR